jgi:hypothetical protein
MGYEGLITNNWDTDLIASNIKQWVSIFGVTWTLTTWVPPMTWATSLNMLNRQMFSFSSSSFGHNANGNNIYDDW